MNEQPPAESDGPDRKEWISDREYVIFDEPTAENDAGARDAAARVRRFLDERQRPQPFAPHGFLPIDVLAVVTRTGDRLLASDLRTLVDALAQVEALADEWGWMKSDDETPSRLEMYLALRAALSVACATCSGRGVWMDEPCSECTRPAEPEPWCCPECRAEGWACPAPCGRPCCVAAMEPCAEFGEHPRGGHANAVRAKAQEPPADAQGGGGNEDTPDDAAQQAAEGAVRIGNTRTSGEWPERQPPSPHRVIPPARTDT